MNTVRANGLRPVLIIVAAAEVLGLVTTVALAAFAGLGPRRPALGTSPWSCAVPELTGTVVDVTPTDMGGIMGSWTAGPGMMMSGRNGPFPPGRRLTVRGKADTRGPEQA